MSDRAENPALKRQIYENYVLRDSEALVVNYLREYRHRVFVCKFCEEDWNTAQEYFDHLPCVEFEDNETNQKALLAANLEAKWKELYNQFRDQYQDIVDGKAPFRAVPYCSCETFKDRQDCQCMAEKRGEAYKKLINQPHEQMLVVYQHYIRAKYDELLQGITNEHNPRTANSNQTCRVAESAPASDEQRMLDRIQELERHLEMKYRKLVTATKKMIEKDIEIIQLRGRRVFEPKTLTAQEIDVITEAILQELKCATFLVQSWGDFTSAHVTNAALLQIQRGLQKSDTREVLEANDIFDTARDCLDKTSVYYAIMAKCTFLHEAWNDATITKTSNRLVRQALWVDTMELEEEFENKWSSHVFGGEAAFQEATGYLEGIGNRHELSAELSSALFTSLASCSEETRKASDLMNRMRENAAIKDWDLMGSDIFDRAVQVLSNPEIPLYNVEEMLREFKI